MADKRFFQNSGTKTLTEITNISGAKALCENLDTNFKDVSSLENAEKDTLTFFDNVKYKDQVSKTKAGACFIQPDMADLLPEGTIALVTKTPYRAYALTAQAFYPEVKPESGISEHALIDPSAQIAEGVSIDAGAIVKANAVIGEGSWIESNAVIGEGVEIGARCRIGVNATVSHALLKDDVRIYTGARIGQDGFGFAIDPMGHVKVPQLGRVIINEHCEIGANTTIDRGAGPDTIIGQGTWIDNLVQIAHNVKIGRGCVIVSQVGISGSTEVGDFSVLAGQVGVAGHLKIGSGVQIAAKSGLMKNVPDGEVYMGIPAKPIKQNMKQVAYLNKMVK
ncbi:MAG: UDP-3-O-(3-hydroxymyristoyl)glucosamine N-acyltransferase [Bdellovibrionales bacterium]